VRSVCSGASLSSWGILLTSSELAVADPRVPEDVGNRATFFEQSLVEGVSGAGVMLGLAILALVRLFSEHPFGSNGRDNKMNDSNRAPKQTRVSTVQCRNYWQYLAETIWAVGAGALASPLATLS
jgi:hypothetical protein